MPQATIRHQAARRAVIFDVSLLNDLTS